MRKRKYVKPSIELLVFELEEDILVTSDLVPGGEDVDIDDMG